MQIFVLGMHRSGTSVVTRLINLMGAYFGPHSASTGSNPENPRGFWERRDVRDENDALLWSAGADWWKVADFSLDRVPEDAVARFDGKVPRILADLEAHRPWVVKEPRFCLLFPMWRRHVETPVCVLVHRSPIQVAHSLQHRNGFPLSFGIALWERYVLDALSSSVGLPRVIVSYERIMAGPVGQMDQLRQKLTGFGINGLRRLSKTEITSFLSTDLFRQRQPAEMESGLLNQAQLELANALSDGTALDFEDVPDPSSDGTQILQLYEEVCASHDPITPQGGDTRVLSEVIDEFRRREEEVMSAVAELDPEGEAPGGESAGLLQHLERTQIERDALLDRTATGQRDIDRLHARIASTEKALDHARCTSRSRARKIRKLQDELDSANTRLEELEARVATLHRIDEARDRHKVRAAELQSLVTQMESELALLRETKATAEAQRRNREQLIEQLLVFLRTAQETITTLLNTNRRHFGPLAIWPRKVSISSLQGFTVLLDDISSWTRRHRSELLTLIGKAGTSSPKNLEHSIPRAHLGTQLSRPSTLSHSSDLHTQTRLRRYGLTVAVIAWDVGHNPLGRAYMLAEALERHYRVIMLGPSFSKYGRDVWEPVSSGSIITIPLPGTSFPNFADVLEKIAPRVAADVIVACKPRLPSVQLGLLMKAFLNRPMIIDIDDYELSFFEHRTPLSLDELAATSDVEDFRIPYGETWTRFTESLLQAADGITVSNEVLRKRYGGTVVPHARDEKRYDPSVHDRAACRRALGIDEHHRVVLFVGTPRRHKGVLEVVRAVKQLGNPDYRMVIVGTPPDRSLAKELRRDGGDTLTLIRSQPFEKLPQIINAADLVCVLQDTNSEISMAQLPAKIIDALAMGVPIIASRVPPLEPFIRAGAVEAVDPEHLPTAIDRILRESAERRRRQLARRGTFLAEYSYSAICQTLVPLINSVVQNPKPVQSETLSFIHLQRPAENPSQKLTASRITHADAMDIVVFWKQNDTGLYGRRHDMLIKYLSRRPEVRKVVVFDHPVSIEFLQERAALGPTTQWREVYRETMIRTWGLRDSEKTFYDCFVYSSNKRDRNLQRWPWWNKQAHLDFLGARFRELDIEPGRAVFWYFPRNFHISEIHEHFEPGTAVVDIVDDHRTWPGTSEKTKDLLTAHYRDALGLADFAFANCETVLDSMSAFNRNIRLVPNACEIEEPPDLAGDPRFAEFRNLDGPKIGFVGNLEAKIDTGLLEYLAAKRPDWQIVLIGSTHINPDILKLDVLPNIHFMGIVPYPAVRTWIREFDVAIVPHVDSAQTRSMNPLKVLVYCSVGVPVVSANVQNLGDFEDFVYIAQNHRQFLKMVELAMKEGRVRNQQLLNDCLTRNSWEARAEEIIGEIVRAEKNTQTARNRPKS